MTGPADVTENRAAWPVRPFLLAAVGLAAAVSVQQLFHQMPGSSVPISTLRIALATGIGTAAVALCFGLERLRWAWGVVFALLIGSVAGLIFYWNGEPGWGMFGEWRSASLLLAIGIAVPLFQVARDEGRWRFPYAEVHGHAWTDVVLWCAACAFVLVVFALAWLMAALFDLIGLHFLRDLLRYDWFNAGLAGAAFGGALGVFRERDAVVLLLQRVVTAVLSVLAPVLGVGLIVFLVALPFTGLGALWEATKSTTPILLSCVVGALILANAVIGNGEDDEATNAVLRVAAMALAAAMLPLAAIAAVAIGLRIGQYGFTPDRLWALVFVILACAYGLAYLAALLRGRWEWAGFARPANLIFAFVVCAIALFLATPLLSFNAISTADQVARLESGRTTPAKFDWAALAFDFGEPGKAALKRLAKSPNRAISTRAVTALAKDSRYDAVAIDSEAKAADNLAARLRILPAKVPLPPALLRPLTMWNACGPNETTSCMVLYTPGSTEVFVLQGGCLDTVPSGKERMVSAPDCVMGRLVLDAGAWKIVERGAGRQLPREVRQRIARGFTAGDVQVRTVPRRQMFVGGVPVGDPFE